MKRSRNIPEHVREGVNEGVGVAEWEMVSMDVCVVVVEGLGVTEGRTVGVGV